MTLIINEKEKKELEKNYDYKKMSYFAYKQLLCLNEIVSILSDIDKKLVTKKE